MDRQAVITKLAKCQFNPIRDVSALEKFTDDGLTALEAHCSDQSEKFSALEGEITDLKDELKTAQDGSKETEKKLRAAEAEVRAAKKTPSEEEWLEKAPASIKSLVERQKKLDDARKEELVGALKTAASGVYSEDDLKGMSIDTLEKTAKLLKLDAPQNVDYSVARPQPRTAENKDDVFANPPDPYAKAIERMRAASAQK